MTTDQEHKLTRLAREIGVAIHPDLAGELGADDIAGYFPRSRRVLYRMGMSDAETFCAVAHELAHATQRDTPTTDPYRHAKQELRADKWAADLLIDIESYEAAEHLVGCHPGALAKELDVTVEMIHTWRAIHSRISLR